MERIQRQATTIKSTESTPYVEKLRKLCIFSPEKRRLRGGGTDMIVVFKYLKGCHRED